MPPIPDPDEQAPPTDEELALAKSRLSPIFDGL